MSLSQTLANNRFILFFSGTHRPYRVAMLVAITILAAWSANYYVQSAKHQQVLKHILSQYGENMTSLATEQLTNSVLNNDAISSQAIAHKIALKSGIVSIIVYDNTNQILAQSIQSTYNQNSTGNNEYTAPILSSENIIGSTSIVINSSELVANLDSPAKWFWSELILILSLIFCILFCVIKDLMAGKEVKASVSKKSHQLVPDTPKKNDAINSSIQAKTSQEPIIYLTITIHNIDTLYKQLNGELRQQQMELLERNMQHASNLYHGKKLIVDNRTIVFLFNDNGKENISNAIYSAQLIIALHQQCKKSMITMSGLIQESRNEKGINKTFSDVRALLKDQLPYSNHIEQALINQYQLDQRLTYKETEADEFSTKITGLKEHYQQLLDNQLTQLLKE